MVLTSKSYSSPGLKFMKIFSLLSELLTVKVSLLAVTTTKKDKPPSLLILRNIESVQLMPMHVTPNGIAMISFTASGTV